MQGAAVGTGSQLTRFAEFGWPRPDASSPINVTLPVPLNLLHNTSSWHALPAFIGELSAARWHAAHSFHNGSRRDSSDEPVSYAIYNHPLPLTATQELRVKLVLAMLSALFVIIPFGYIPVSGARRARAVHPSFRSRSMSPF